MGKLLLRLCCSALAIPIHYIIANATLAVQATSVLQSCLWIMWQISVYWWILSMVEKGKLAVWSLQYHSTWATKLSTGFSLNTLKTLQFLKPLLLHRTVLLSQVLLTNLAEKTRASPVCKHSMLNCVLWKSHQSSNLPYSDPFSHAVENHLFWH